MKKLLTLCFIVILTFKAYAQDYIIKGIPIESESQLLQRQINKLSDHFKSYDLYEISNSSFAKPFNREGQISLELTLGIQHHWNLQLSPNDLQNSEGYSTLVQNEEVIQMLAKREITTYKGYIEDDLSSTVRLSLRNSSISGLIMVEGKSHYIESASRYVDNANPNLYIVYDPKSVIINENAYCSLQKIEETEALIDRQVEIQSNNSCKKAKIAIAADRSMLNKFGTVENVEDEILDILNIVEGRYLHQEINIAFEIRTLFIFESDDPWDTPASIGDLLGKFRTWGNNGGFQTLDYATATLWTAINFGPGPVGLAYISSTCRSTRYHVNNHFTNNKTQLVQLHAHELGHNWSAGHTQSNNNTFVMSPSIGNLNDQWHEASISAIVNHKNNSTCLISDCDATTNLQVVADFTNVTTCFGEEVGAIQLSVSGGVSPYSFEWSNGATTQNIENLGGGEYSVIITDANNESIEVSYFLQQPRQILFWNYVELACGESNMAQRINVNVSGGNDDYLFSWSDGQDSSSIFNVPSGEYVLTVTHKVTGCFQSDTIIVPEYEPMSINFTDLTHSICSKDNGTVSAELAGGNDKSNIFWLNQGDDGNDGSGGRGLTLFDLAPGTYVAAAYTNNCEVIDTVYIDEIPILHQLASEICEEDSYEFNGVSLTESGIYSDTLQLANACDSVVQLNLKVNIINAELNQVHDQLSAEQEGASYQWLQCNDDFEAIVGANSQDFVVSEDGAYAVEITLDNCVKISSCTDFIILSNAPSRQNLISIYPNPTTQKVNISFPEAHNDPYALLDMSGKIVRLGKLKQAETVIDLSRLSDGIYYLQTLDQTFKIIKRE